MHWFGVVLHHFDVTLHKFDVILHQFDVIPRQFDVILHNFDASRPRVLSARGRLWYNCWMTQGLLCAVGFRLEVRSLNVQEFIR